MLIPKRLRTEWMDVMALDATFSHVAFRAACVIGSHFNRHTGQGFLSLETLARAMGVCERTAWTGSKEAEKRGYVIIRRREPGQGTRKAANGREIKFRAAGGKGVANVYLPALNRSQVAASNPNLKLAARCNLLWEQCLQEPSPKVAPACKPTLTSPSEKNLPGSARLSGQSSLGSLAAVIEGEIGRDQFRSWFRDLSVVSEKEDVVTIGLPSKFYCNEIEKRFGHKLLKWCQSAYPGKQLVKIVDLSNRS